MNERPTPARTAKEAAEQALDAKEHIDRRIDDFLASADNQTQQHINGWIGRIQNEFNDRVQESRSEALGKLNGLATQVNELVQEQKAVLHGLEAERKDQYARDEQAAHELLAKQRSILGTATGETLSSKHHERAEQIRTQADMWAKGTIALWIAAILMGIGFTVWQFVEPPQVNSIYELLPRILNVSPIAVVVAAAQFASRQTHGHRRAERAIEHTALQLDAAEPFVAAIGVSSKIQVIRPEDIGNLPQVLQEHIGLINEAERKRLQVRLKLADKLFLGTEEANDTD